MQIEAQWLTDSNRGQNITRPAHLSGNILNVDHKRNEYDETTWADRAAGRERIVSFYEVAITIGHPAGAQETVTIDPETIITLEDQ